MARSTPWERMLTALGDPYRRRLLVALAEHNPQRASGIEPVETIEEGEVGTEMLHSQLQHVHLPKLAAMGYVIYDEETDEVVKGERWPEIAPLVTLIHDHRAELPEGWL